MIRQIPEQFSWVDHRLVRERYIDYICHGASALYLFLITVSDASGLSYYGDATLQKRLGMDGAGLSKARDGLIRQQLIAYQQPLYQVLALDHRREKAQVTTELSSMKDILQQVMGGGHD
jgi:hypothetical protein